MAGIVSTQCGIPLRNQSLILADGPDRRAAGDSANAFGEAVNQYLPGATCLGDVLEHEGYTNVYFGGADTNFAGKNNFLREHGFSKVSGLDQWKGEGADESDISSWGLSDSVLIEKAKQEVSQLHASGEPFNFSMITLDTHEPGGVYASCGSDDEMPMKRALRCSTTAVADFLMFLEDQGYLDDTVVVVMGDHLKQTGSGTQYNDELMGADSRTIFYKVHSPNVDVSFSREGGDQLSVLATTLDLLGLTPSAGRAGLGVSLIGNYGVAGTALALAEDDYFALLDAPSADLYRYLWSGEGYDMPLGSESP